MTPAQTFICRILFFTFLAFTGPSASADKAADQLNNAFEQRRKQVDKNYEFFKTTKDPAARKRYVEEAGTKDSDAIRTAVQSFSAQRTAAHAESMLLNQKNSPSTKEIKKLTLKHQEEAAEIRAFLAKTNGPPSNRKIPGTPPKGYVRPKNNILVMGAPPLGKNPKDSVKIDDSPKPKKEEIVIDGSQFSKEVAFADAQPPVDTPASIKTAGAKSKAKRKPKIRPSPSPLPFEPVADPNAQIETVEYGKSAAPSPSPSPSVLPNKK